MKQSVYNNCLYVIEKIPYEITEDTNVDKIYVPADSLNGYKELNPNLPILPYNYGIFKITKNEFEDAFDVIVTTESNTALMTVLYTKGLAAHEDYMTLAEAKAVTNEQLDGLLNGNNTVVTFNEFKYFTNVTKVGSSDDANESKTTSPFRQCTSLKEITLPKSVNELGARAFDACGNVDRINGLENIRKFNHCSLQSTFAVDSSMNINTIYIDQLNGTACLNNVNHSEYVIKNIVINDNVSIIPRLAFAYNYYTENIKIPNHVTSIGDSAFVACRGLKRFNSDIDGIVNIPDSVITIGEAIIYPNNKIYNEYITEINIPDSVTTIGQYAFANHVKCNTLNIGSGITSIGSHAFNYVGRDVEKFTMTIKAITPPTWDGYLNNVEDISIYVPAESVDDYKAASGWSKYANKIKPIE